MNLVLLSLHRIWLLIYAPLLVILTALSAITIFILRYFVGERRAGRMIATRWARTAARLLPIQVSISGRENIDPDQAYIVVANHLSQLDILVIYGWSGLDLRWIIKQELRKVPIIGWGCKIAGHIFIDRSNRDAAVEAMNSAVAALEPGEGMMFFPEGTRSKSGKLLPFKNGAFRMALQLKFPILPVTITDTYPLMPSGSNLPRFGKVGLHIHEPIITSDLDESDTKNITLIRRLARAEIKTALPDEA